MVQWCTPTVCTKAPYDEADLPIVRGSLEDMQLASALLGLQAPDAIMGKVDTLKADLGGIEILEAWVAFVFKETAKSLAERHNDFVGWPALPYAKRAMLQEQLVAWGREEKRLRELGMPVHDALQIASLKAMVKELAESPASLSKC